MVTVFADTPPTTPPPALTVPTAALLLVHVPPGVVELSVVVAPVHTVLLPVMAAGNGLTVTTAVRVQPLVPKHVIVAVPAATPLTIPDDEPMVAIAVLLLLHVAPMLVVLNVVLAPAQTANVPVMALGAGCTVTTTVVKHAEEGSVYVIVVVPPARPTPVTTPEDEPTVATAGVLLLHVPPGVVWLSADVMPGQSTVTPLIAPGVGLTVSTASRKHSAGGILYVILVVPTEMPVKVPGGAMVANPPGVIVHVPPAGEEEMVVVFPTHVTSSPVRGAGSGLIVMVLVIEQPVTGIV